MGAGGGYSTELMARAVAPDGIVYGQNPPDLGEQAKAAFEARLKSPTMKDVVADIQPFDDPIPPGVHDLDFITFLFYYHDTTYMAVDRAQMNRKLFAALKPGGSLVIADHSALPSQGTSVGKTLHRIERATLRQEVEAAGFKLVSTGDFWRNPNDSHDFPSFKPDMPVDNFVLKFEKPGAEWSSPPLRNDYIRELRLTNGVPGSGSNSEPPMPALGHSLPMHSAP